MKNQPGYPLPDGELGEDEIVCQLVYLPDRPEYWQAFLGALHYMTTWRAWERDDDKRGRDAAANWRDAFELTMECWRMACLEELQANVAAILALMQNQICCEGGAVTYGDSTVYITTIVPDSGDAPDYYGETAVTDWDDWREHVCHNAHLWVDELILQAGNIEAGLEFGGTTVALIAAAIVGVSFFVVGGVVAMPIVYAAVAGMAGVIASTVFSDAADDLEAARDAIVCAFLQGTDVSLAVEDALESGTAWDLFYSFLDYESATAIIYEGGNGETYLEPDLKDDCDDCDEIGEYQVHWDFEAGFGSWANNNAETTVNGYIGNGIRTYYGANKWASLSVNSLITDAGLTPTVGDEVQLHSVTVWSHRSDAPARPVPGMLNVHDGGTNYDSFTDSATWIEHKIIFDPPLVAQYAAGNIIRLYPIGGTGNNCTFDEVSADLDIVRA